MYHNIRLEDRTCELYQSNEIEDEIHFIYNSYFYKCKEYSIIQ